MPEIGVMCLLQDRRLFLATTRILTATFSFIYLLWTILVKA